jgi:O-antigen ligase
MREGIGIADQRNWRGTIYQLLLGLLLLLLPVQFALGTEIRFAPSDVVLLLLVLFGGFRIATSRDDWSAWHLVLLAMFSASLLTSALRYGSVTRWALINKYVGLLVLLVLYLVIVQYARTPRAVWRIAQLVVWSVFLQGVFALPLYFIGLRYAPLHTYRIQALAADPNAYGGLVVLAIALHWATVNTPARLISRRLAWPVTLVLVLNLLLCFSRSAWIGFVFVVLSILIFRRRAWPHVAVPFALGVSLVLIFFRSYFITQIWPLIDRHEQVTARVVIIEDAMTTFVAHPIFGGGLGSYIDTYGYQIHNTFFWMLAEMGVVGATVFIIFVGIFALRGYRAYKAADEQYRGLMAGLLIAHLAMIGLSVGIEAFYQRSWWVVMALLNASWVLMVKRGAVPVAHDTAVTAAADGAHAAGE